MSIYSDKLAHIVTYRSLSTPLHKCAREDTLAHNLGMPYFDDVMSYKSLTKVSNHNKTAPAPNLRYKDKNYSL